MKKLILTLFLANIIVIAPEAVADNVIPMAPAVKIPVASLDFTETYKIPCENLFYLLLSALNENNYSIEEIKFKTGSVIFKAYKKEFIALISAKDSNNSFIKIIPTDNNYNFSPQLIQKLHKYIELNNGISIKNIL